MTGESRRLSPGVAEPPEKAEFGAVLLAVVEVTHKGGFPVGGVLAVVQPAGSAGAVTPSKFSV
jgi:hypothetical protein